jgi:hypothetical protein
MNEKMIKNKIIALHKLKKWTKEKFGDNYVCDSLEKDLKNERMRLICLNKKK